MSRRAFALAELLLVVMLMAGMLAFGLMSSGSQRNRASSQALVQNVASELQAARAQALRNHSPVAVCFPSQNGRSACSQSLYWMEGLARGEVTRVVQYAREYPDSVIAVGQWGTASINRPVSGEAWDAAGPQRWLGTGFRDYALIFTPDGSLTSNDLPLVNGAYHLLVAAQVQAAPAAAPPGTATVTTPPGYFSVSSVYAAHTIRLTPCGVLSLESGVADNQGVTISPVAIAGVAPAPAVVPPTVNAQAPSILGIEVSPRPISPSTTSSVQKGRCLTLKVRARDPRQEPLTCSWTAQNLSGGSEVGGFSFPAGTPMDWSPQAGEWVLTCTWTPPSGASAGNTFRLECKVEDPGGLSDTQTSPAVNPVTVIPGGKVCYSWHASPWRYDISVVDSDGSNEKRLTSNPADDDSPSFSPDGQKIVFVSKRTGQTEIFCMNADGSDQRRLTTNSNEDWDPSWSADGTQIFFGRNWPDRVYVMNADGSGAVNLSTGGYASEYQIRNSPDGRYVAYTGNCNAPGVPQVSGEVVVGEFVNDRINPPRVVDATNLTQNSSQRIMDSFHCWYPDNSGRFLYSSTDPQGAQFYTNALRTLRVARLVDNGAGNSPRFQMTDIQDISSTTNYYSDYGSLRLSPDMRNLVLQQGSYGYIADYDPTATPPTITRLRRLTNTTNFQMPGNWSRK